MNTKKKLIEYLKKKNQNQIQFSNLKQKKTMIIWKINSKKNQKKKLKKKK